MAPRFTCHSCTGGCGPDDALAQLSSVQTLSEPGHPDHVPPPLQREDTTAVAAGQEPAGGLHQRELTRHGTELVPDPTELLGGGEKCGSPVSPDVEELHHIQPKI